MQAVIMSTTGTCRMECLSLLATKEDMSKSKLLFCTHELIWRGCVWLFRVDERGVDERGVDEWGVC